MSTDFFNLYVEKLSTQVGELSKLIIVKETTIEFQKRSMDAQAKQIEDLTAEIEKLKKPKGKKREVGVYNSVEPVETIDSVDSGEIF